MRLKKIMTLLLVATVFLVACNKSDNATKPETSSPKEDNQILSIGLTNPITLFNVLNTPDVQSRWGQRFMYEPLVHMVAPLTFQPRLAESFETEDNITYAIKLNDQAKWTDGTPVTVDDVIFTFELFANPDAESNRGPAFSLLEGVGSDGKLANAGDRLTSMDKINDLEMTFKTAQPTDQNLIKEFIGDNILILPKHIWETADPADLPSAEFVTTPTVTSGPYKFVTFENDAYLELARNDEFYLGQPKIEKVFLRMMSASNIATELTSGGLVANAGGGIGLVVEQDIDTLMGNDNLSVKSVPSLNPQVMLYNMDKIEDVTIRQAIAHAINREAIVDQLLQGRGEIINSAFGEQHPYKNKTMDMIPYDPQKAEELIAASDFDLSQELELIVPLGNLVREQSANLIAADLEKVGFTVTQTTYDFPTLLERGRAGEFHLMLVGYGITVDPDVSTYLSKTGASHYSNYDSDENERLLSDGRKAIEMTEKKAIYDQLQELWATDLPTLPLYNADYVNVKQKSFKGGIHDFWQGTLSDIHEWEFD